MSRVRFDISERAQRDLLEIKAYLRLQSDQAWPLTKARLWDVFRSVAKNPGIGFQHPDLADPRYRVQVVGSYLVVYTPGTRPVSIVRVFHAARDAGRVMRPS